MLTLKIDLSLFFLKREAGESHLLAKLRTWTPKWNAAIINSFSCLCFKPNQLWVRSESRKTKSNLMMLMDKDGNRQKVTWRSLLSLHGCSSGFLTGFRRAPILGMNQVRMEVRATQIQTGQHYDQHFPESLTCHSILYLPLYSSKEIMRDRLTEALIVERGFEMWWWICSCWTVGCFVSGLRKGGII